MEISELPKDKKIILFDGVCNLCDKAVQFIIKHDKKDVFRFVPLQSELGQKILTHVGIDTKHIDSIVMFEPGVAYYYKSAAAVEIARNLGGFLNLATLVRILPTSLVDRWYDQTAKNRYRRYGKKQTCMIPTPELQQKFL